MNASAGPSGDVTGAGSDIEEDLLRFLESKTRISWDRDLDLFAAGGLSSLFAMELVVHMEREHGISIRGADLSLKNFRTVRVMAELVHRLQAQEAGDGSG